jgi:hypothetical protein
VNEVQLEAKHGKARTMVEYGNRGPSRIVTCVSRLQENDGAIY